MWWWAPALEEAHAVEHHADKISQAPPNWHLELDGMETGLYCCAALHISDWMLSHTLTFGLVKQILHVYSAAGCE